jgi:putative transposase
VIPGFVKPSLDPQLNLITDLVADGLLFCRLLFRSRTALSAEILFLRKQLAFYEESQVQPRRLNDSARLSLILCSRLCNWKGAFKPETLISRHGKGFKLFWKWKSRAGRPRLPESIRKLIVRAQENPTWGQARVAAELPVKLGIYVSPRPVRAYWPPEPERRGNAGTCSQNWRTFVRNHAQSIVACDFLVVVTARFRTLYVFLLMEVGTRRIVHCNVTAHPTGTWTLQQLREAIPSDHSYRFLIRGRVAIFSVEVDQQLKAFWTAGAAHASASTKGERLLRAISGKHTPGVFGFHDSTGRETSSQNPGGVGDSLQPGTPSFEPRTGDS